MKRLGFTSVLLTCALFLGLVTTSKATNRYWDSDGNTNPGLGVAGTLDWVTNTPWTTDATGDAGTITAWVSSGDVAIFNGNGAATSTVSSSVTCAGFNLVNSPASAINATVNLSGPGSVTSTQPIYIGDYYGPGGSTATLNLYNTLTYSGSGGVVYIGGTGCAGTVNLIGTNAYLGGYSVDIGGNGSSGTVNVTGGTLNSFGNPYISRSGNATLNVSGTGLVQFNNTIICDTVGDSGTVNLNGGRMVLGAISKGVTGTNTYAIFNFNGGVLAGSKSASPWLPITLDQLNVLGGGAVIDSVTYGLYIFPPLVTGVTGGLDGGLTKLSSGSLTLYGTNTYTGPTLVSAGTLVLNIPAGLNSSIPDSDLITVSPGATFNVTAVASGFVLGIGQTLSGGGAVSGGVTVANSSTAIVHPGGGGTNATTLTISGNLTFAGSSAQATLDLSSTYNGSNDKIALANKQLTCGGAQVSINCGSVLDTNDYVLFDAGASGSISGSFNPTPVWAGTVPNYASGYTIVTGTRYVTLHYTRIPVTISGVTASNKVYDSTPVATLSSGTVSGLVSPDTTATVTVAPGTGVFASSNVGTWGITASGFSITGADAGYYSLQGQPSGLTASISPSPLTITANPASMNYGSTVPTLSGSVTGFVGSDNQANATTGALSFGTMATPASPVGSYAITGSGLTAVNYTFAQASANATALAVNPATLTVTADSYSQAYGSTNPVLAAGFSGFVNGDTSSVVSGSPDLSTAVITNTTVGVYPVTIVDNGTLSAANYTFSDVNGTLTVTQAVLTVTADDTNRIYGATNPVFSAAISGLVNGESATDTNVLTGAADLECVANATSPIGNYDITAAMGTLAATNYSFVFSNGTLAVVTAQLTGLVGVSDKTYDGTTNATITSETLSGVLNGDDVSLTGGTASFSDKNVATGKTVTVTGLSLGGSQAANYALLSSTVTTNASINAATLTITAAANTKTYDGTTSAAAIPTTAGLFGSDSVSGLSESYGDQNVGTGKTLAVNGGYTVNDGNAGNNYTVNTANSTAGEIDPLAITITAGSNEKIYDGTVSATNVPTVSPALAAGDSAAFTVTYDTPNVGGGKTLTPAGLVSDGNGGNNYSYTYATSTAGVVDAAALTITADNANKTYGQAVVFAGTEFTTSLLVAGDSVTSVTLTSAGAAANAPVSGSPYSIIPSAAVGSGLSNYDINYVNGTLTVTASASPTATSIIVNNGIATVAFAGIADVTYVTQSATNPLGPWTAISTNTPSVGGIWTVTDTNVAAQTFYRTMIP